jgi:hypothetical protein
MPEHGVSAHLDKVPGETEDVPHRMDQRSLAIDAWRTRGIG